MHFSDEVLVKQLEIAAEQPEAMDKEKLKAILKESRKRIRRFERILKQSDKQILQQVHNVEQEFLLRMENERLLAQQAKHAAMGEMMDAVAHQWKQPLNAISMLTDLLLIDYRSGDVNEPYLKEYKKELWGQIEHLLNTLSEFRTFFRPNKTAKQFSAKNAVGAVLLLTKDEFMKNGISINVITKRDARFYGIENEFKHIVLNIINNSKDAFKNINSAEKTITITIDSVGDEGIVSIEDNAGGIPAEILDDIFKPNVTTKEEEGGTGIGLYMSSQIAQKMHAKLKAENSSEGALFTFRATLPKETT